MSAVDRSMDEIAAAVEDVKSIIAAACDRAGRDPQAVTLVAVSKKKSVAEILAAIDAGVQHFGENRVEEAEEKIPQVREQSAAPITWHMVGHIQSRKARDVVPLFDVVEAVDSIKLARKLSGLAVDASLELDVLAQVNISGEASKSGFEAVNWASDGDVRKRLWDEIATIAALPGLSLRGLMTMAPIVPEMEAVRPIFADLAKLKDALNDSLPLALADLSMGMTDDYPVAIEEGATIIRVGRAIFGERAY